MENLNKGHQGQGGLEPWVRRTGGTYSETTPDAKGFVRLRTTDTLFGDQLNASDSVLSEFYPEPFFKSTL